MYVHIIAIAIVGYRLCMSFDNHHTIEGNHPGVFNTSVTLVPDVMLQLDIVSAFQSYGEKVYDRITEEERVEIVRNSCPGPGACGGMYTANTMATAIEALGMALPYSSR